MLFNLVLWDNLRMKGVNRERNKDTYMNIPNVKSIYFVEYGN